MASKGTHISDRLVSRFRNSLAGLGATILDLPPRAFVDGSRAVVGRPQAGWGRWWGEHPRLMRTLAVLAITWMVAYLVWRIGWSWHGASLLLFAMLIVAEFHGLWNLVFLTWFSWRISPATRPPVSVGHSVDVLICTYDEPASVLRSTLAGCSLLTYPHTTYLLDDGRRPEMRTLATEWGARYLTRADNSHAKAGNINHALPLTEGDLTFVLDADHVPLPDALDAIVGYFDDDRMAVVQTPHDFYNHDSVQHYEIGRHEQSVFYSVICPGKDRHGAAFWCGSGALFRRAALLEIGGVAVETIAEDFHTTIKLQREGWRSRYHDEVLVQGLAPHDLAAYLLQRDRWARGNLAVFATPESPLRARELSALQRLSYFASLSSYLAGPMRLLMLVTLAAVLWSGQLPLTASLLTLGLLWGPATFLSIAAGSALCRGYQKISDTTHFELCTAEIFTRALRCAVRPGRTTFKVTPKEGVDLGGLTAIRQLRFVTVLAAVLFVGVVMRALDELGVNVLPDMHGIALWVVLALGVFELRRMLRTLALVGRRRQRRNEYRMPLESTVAFALTDQAEAVIIGRARDLSPSGIRLELPEEVPVATAGAVTFNLPTVSGTSEPHSVELEVQSCRPSESGWTIGARITAASTETRHRVIEYCYVVSAETRLRGGQPVALPEPSELGVLPSPRSLPGISVASGGMRAG